MGFPTKVQLIRRKASEQWYINFPSALAQAMDFSRGETVEWTVEDKSLLALRRLHPPAPTLKKTPPPPSPPSPPSGPTPPPTPNSKETSPSPPPALQHLWHEGLPAFDQQRVAQRAQALSLSSLLCLGRHTVTSLSTTCGFEFHDWSAEYRRFSRQRFPTDESFSVIRRAVLAELPSGAPLCVAIDDSLLHTTGLCIPRAAWRRDPLGPSSQPISFAPNACSSSLRQSLCPTQLAAPSPSRSNRRRH